MKNNLFSSNEKTTLASMKEHYLYNKRRVGRGELYSLQANQFAQEILDTFKRLAKMARFDEDITEICTRISDCLQEDIELSAKTFDERLAELNDWLETRYQKVSKNLNRVKKKMK